MLPKPLSTLKSLIRLKLSSFRSKPNIQTSLLKHVLSRKNGVQLPDFYLPNKIDLSLKLK